MHNLKYALCWLAVLTIARLISPNIIVHLAFLVTLLLHLAFPRRLTILPALVLFPIFALFLRYVASANDFLEFLRTLVFYGYALALIFVLYRYTKLTKSRVYILGFIMLAAALGLEESQTMHAIKPLWNTELDPWLRDVLPKTTSIYPMGQTAPIVSNQGLRYPELGRNEFSFLGSRASFCESYDYYHRIESCSFGATTYPYAIWTTYFLTKPFVDLFMSESRMADAQKSIAKSFTQGLDEFASPEGNFIREKPMCSDRGYLEILEVHGDGIQFALGTSETRIFTLPVFADERIHALTSRPLIEAVSEEGLIQLKLTAGPAVAFIKPPRIWTWVVVSFWLPAIIWLVWAFSLLGRKTYLVCLRR